MTTLYISDLDGTLLHDNQQVSPFSASVINRAVERGLLFSLATARSLIGLGMLDLQGIHWNTPLVLMNGVMLYDMASRAILQSCEMPPDAVAAVLAACAAEGKNPFLYRVEDGQLHACFGRPVSGMLPAASRLRRGGGGLFLPAGRIRSAGPDPRPADRPARHCLHPV